MEEQQNKRIRRTSVEIKRLLEDFNQAGIVAKEFCILHNISEAGFYKWRSRYSEVPQVKKNSFITLKNASVLPREGSLFAEVRGIRIFQPVAASYLKELLT